MAVERLVVVGGDAAGMSAASQARRLKGPAELEIVAFERGHFTSYSACGIPYWVGGQVGGRDELIARTPEEHRARGIDLRTRTEVVGSTWRGAG
ncbi:flavoprotein oxidoreductase, partial [Streptomyces sp. C]